MGKRALAVLLTLMLAACAGTPEATDAKLGEAVQGLPGLYDRQGESGEAKVLVIMPIFVASLTGYRFYMQEMVAQDPRRVTAQRVLSFDPGGKGKFVQTLWTLKDPARWRAGPSNPELFKGMVGDDVKAVGRAEVTAEQLTATELAFEPSGRIATNTGDAGLVRYRKR
jgi:hypothetical protein